MQSSEPLHVVPTHIVDAYLGDSVEQGGAWIG